MFKHLQHIFSHTDFNDVNARLYNPIYVCIIIVFFYTTKKGSSSLNKCNKYVNFIWLFFTRFYYQQVITKTYGGVFVQGNKVFFLSSRGFIFAKKKGIWTISCHRSHVGWNPMELVNGKIYAFSLQWTIISYYFFFLSSYMTHGTYVMYEKSKKIEVK